MAGVSRATVYAHQKPKPVDESDLLLSRLIDCKTTRHPFYGSRKMEALRATASQKSSAAIKVHRTRHSLGHKTPDVVYQTAMGGGTMILDK